MIEPTVINGKALIACHSRIGAKTVKGPTTGEDRHITQAGVWMPLEDAELLNGKVQSVWCPRKQCNIEIIAFFYLDPTADQIRRA